MSLHHNPSPSNPPSSDKTQVAPKEIEGPDLSSPPPVLESPEQQEAASIKFPPLPELRKKELLDAIVSNPDDDAPRMAFAEFLHEQGRRVWASFIRDSITLTELDPHTHEYRALAKRCARLSNINSHRMFPGTMVLSYTEELDVRDERGFAKIVTLDPTILGKISNEELQQVLTQPVVTDLEFEYMPAGKKMEEVLALAPNLRRLLFNVDSAHAPSLYKSLEGTHPNIQEIVLRSRAVLSSNDIIALSNFAPQLRSLEVESTKFGSGSLCEAAVAPFSKLEQLTLFRPKFRSNSELTFLSELTPGIRSLTLSGIELHPLSFGYGYSNPKQLEALEVLRLEKITGLSAPVMERFGRIAPRVSELFLDQADIEPRFFVELVGAGLFPALRNLYMPCSVHMSELDITALPGVFPKADIHYFA